MLLTITTTYQPATDLGYLLHKHPDRCQSFDLPFGQAHVCYPEATPSCCTAALVLDVDPVRLARHERDAVSGRPLEPYVNDRPYVASSFLSVAIAQVYGSALAGQCKQRPDLVNTPLALHARLVVIPCHGGADLLQRLFAPLGYTVQTTTHPLDSRDPDAGDSPYVTVDLQAQTRLRDLLTHLYVLVPVLDDQKHYYVGEAEVEKLLRRGEDWLAQHPERELITRRYLKHRRSLTRVALARLAEEDTPDPEAAAEAQTAAEGTLEQPLRLHQQRMEAVATTLMAGGARRVLDLGCGEGHLLQRLLADPFFTEIVGMDVSVRALERAHERLKLERLPPAQRSRITLLHGALTYRDKRLMGYDGAALIEVIEHLDPSRLPVFARVVFGAASPAMVVITTPNAEYNALFPTLPAGKLRHRDHRFEWSRLAFTTWAEDVAQRYGYTVSFQPIGPFDATHGTPTQMGVFRRDHHKTGADASWCRKRPVRRSSLPSALPYSAAVSARRQAADWGPALANTSHSASAAEQPPQVLSVTPPVRSRMDKSKWHLALHEGGVPASQWASPRFVMVSSNNLNGLMLEGAMPPHAAIRSRVCVPGLATYLCNGLKTFLKITHKLAVLANLWV